MNTENLNSPYSLNLNIFFNNQEQTTKFNLIYTNIRSLRKNFCSFLVELSKIETEIHFIVLSEVWIGSDEIALYNIPGFKAYFNCNDNYRAGGVVCFVNNYFVVNTIHFEFKTADILILNVKVNNLFLKLFCLYRLQQYSQNDFNAELSKLLEHITGNVIYVGDVNINLLSKDSTTLAYHSLLNNNGFLSLVNSPTRITSASQTCIDHVFVRHRDICSFKSDVFDIGVTDHCILGLKYVNPNCGINERLNDSHLNEAVGTRYCDINLIKNKIKEVNFNHVLASNDVNLSYNKFQNILSHVLDSCMKNSSPNSKLNRAKNVTPWITSTILKKISKRKKLYKIYKRRPYDTKFESYFHRFSSNLTQEIDLTKNQFYESKLEKCKGDSAGQWRIINGLTGRKNNSTVDKIELHDNTIVSDPAIVARLINEHFISVQSGQMTSQGTVADGTLPSLYNQPRSFFFMPATVEEVKTVINSLKNKRSTGFDFINVEVVKSIANDISPALVHIMNLSFVTGVFPDMLKLSIVVPIWKKNDSLKLDNLRPISLLSVFSKLFEKICNVRLLKYLNYLEFFSGRQFGFIKGRSTEDALITVTDQIYNNYNLNLKTTGIFIDFKKAFDFVNHSILLNKLEAAGIRGVALDWFESFFTKRSQKVKVGNYLSTPHIVKSGVPQGSVMSATLFLIFINDLLELPFRGRINAFADDIALFYSHGQGQVIADSISHDMALLRSWCVKNCMEVNVSKTKYINFDSVGFTFQSQIKYHDLNCNAAICNCQVIEKVSSFKYLGVTLDEKMSWDIHITELHRKIRCSIRTFYFLRNFCNAALLRTLYFALVNSKLQYGITCWGSSYKYLIDRLRVTQNFFIRIILKQHMRESSAPLYKELKILPVQHLFVYKVLRLFYMRSGNRNNDNRYYMTRSAVQGVFRLPKVNKLFFRRSLLYLGPKFFNQLPDRIKYCNGNRLFCRKLFNWLLDRDDVSNMSTVLG